MDPISRRRALKGLGLAAGVVAASAVGAGQALAAPASTQLRVLAINTWMNGTKVANGLDLLAGIIKSTGASVVLISEGKTATEDLVPILADLA